MKASWKLSSRAMIENVKHLKHELKQRRDNSEVIKIDFLNNDQMKQELAMSDMNTNYENISEPYAYNTTNQTNSNT